MDIAKLGIEIDPRRAVRGANRIEKELKDVGRAADKNLAKVDKGARKAGRSATQAGKKVQAMGRKSKRSFGQMSSGAIGLLDGFGLMNNGLGGMVRRAEGAVRGVKMLTDGQKALSKGSAEAGGKLRQMGSGAGAAGAGASSMMAGLLPLIVVIGSVVTAALAAVVAFKAMKLGLKLIGEGITASAAIEDAKIGIAVLLGSFDKAQARIEELSDFAASTPFQLPDLLAASRTLQIFTDGTLATGDGLRMIGDAAAGANRPISEVAMWIGRLYAGLKGGQPIGEATMRLLEMGLLVPKVKSDLDKMAATGNSGGKNFETLWEKATEGLSRFSGTMAIQSQAWNGKISTLKDNWDQFLIALGDPIKDALKPVLNDLIELVISLKPIAAAVGETISNAIKLVVQLIKEGNIQHALGLALAAGIEWGIGFLIRSASLAFVKITEMLLNAFVWSIDAFFSLMTGAITMIGGSTKEEVGGSLTDTAKGFQQVMTAIAAILGQVIKNALGEAMDTVATGFKNVMVGIINLVVKGLNKAVDTAISLAPGAGTVLDAFGMNKRVPEVPIGPDANFFTPKPVDYAGLNKVLLDILPSQNQEEFGDFVGNQLDRFDKANPGFDDSMLPKPAIALPPEEDIPDAIAVKAEKVKKATEGALTPIQELISSWADFDANMQDFTVGTLQTFSNSMTDGVMAIIDGTKSAGEAFGDMAASILQQVMQMIVQLTIQAALVQAIGGSPFAGLLTSAPGVIPNALPVAHGGASGGVDSVGARMNGSTSSSERRAIVDKNESVLTRSDSQNLEMDLARARGDNAGDSKSGSQGVTIVNALDPQTVQDAIAANPSVVFNAISRNRKQFKAMMK